MNEETYVDIRGLDKAAVLAALYNASAPLGLGIFQARPGEMTAEQAGDQYIDYVYGRPLKLKPLSDDGFDAWLYDRDNGGAGAAQRVVDQLRAGG